MSVKLVFAALASIVLAPPAFAAPLFADALKGATVSICVTTIDGKRIYGYNEAQRVIPASNQKLFTAAFALSKLGPEYKAKTSFWVRPDHIDVASAGDPSLTYPELKSIADRLNPGRQLPINLFQSYRPGIPPTWEFDDLPNRYACAVTAFCVDRGGFELWSKDRLPYFKNFPQRVFLHRGSFTGKPTVQYDPISRLATVNGALPAGDFLLDTLAQPEPDRTAALVLGSDVRFVDTIPADPPTLVIEGKSLGDLAKECLPPSDNPLAEHLLLMAASKNASLGIGAYPPARKALTTFLTQEVEIDQNDIVASDGSGLSRQNQATTRALVQTLCFMAKSPYKQVWMDALVRPGLGTLKNRLLGSKTFRGKTGGLTGVAALSGYAMLRSGETVVVSMVLNALKGPPAPARDAMDQVIVNLEQANIGEIQPTRG